MGYTHYYDQPRNIKRETFARMRRDIQEVITALHKAGLPLAGWDGTGKPEFEIDRIAFNGQVHCGHAPDTTVMLAPQTGTTSGIALLWGSANDALADDGHGRRHCDGDCSHEDFTLYQNCVPTRDGSFPFAEGRSFTKTSRKAYDFAVTAALIIAKRYLGSAITIDSDGGDRDWEAARRICHAVLGYGQEYHLGADGLIATHELGERARSTLNTAA